MIRLEYMNPCERTKFQKLNETHHNLIKKIETLHDSGLHVNDIVNAINSNQLNQNEIKWLVYFIARFCE